MKFAALSDIHGNIRALNAVLSDIDRRGIKSIVNLGDCAYGPFDPRPVMNRLMELGLPTVSGNEDRILVEAAQGGSHSRTATVCAKLLERSHVEWLNNLPTTLHVHKAFLFHGLPGDNAQYLLTAVEKSGVRSSAVSEIEQLLAGHNHPLILCGHDHMPRMVRLTTEQMIVNPGSVGCPAYTDDVPYEHTIENGSPHARYGVIEIRGKEVTVELISVSYDWEAAAGEARTNGFPDWAHWITTGRTI